MEILISIICMFIFVVYVYVDNKIIKIRYQDVKCGNSNNIIRIMQISDLHSKKLRNADYNKLNRLKYDVIAFTGDTFVDEDKNYDCIILFMKNIKNKGCVIYVDGNNGTKAYDRHTNNLTEFGKKLEDLGIIVIRDYVEYEGVIFTNYNAITSKLLDNDARGKYKIYDTLTNSMKKCKKLNIGVTHYPLTRKSNRYS